MIRRLNIDHMTLITLAMFAAMPFMAATPAAAATADCEARFETVRVEAATAEPKAAAKALRTARVAVKICAEGNHVEAARKFDVAQQQLGDKLQVAARN
ncbi:hypothetical protein [Sandarakinorhabdus sp. DWP1-3-1]|uniref:hypothetical protein n=1 Tax=Sandarakinorhabdus sp. DWP1-3-1 TaxID=2804627 RepID=UPI003CFA1CAA